VLIQLACFRFSPALSAFDSQIDNSTRDSLSSYYHNFYERLPSIEDHPKLIMAPMKRVRNDDDDEVVAVESASSSLRISSVGFSFNMPSYIAFLWHCLLTVSSSSIRRRDFQ
jgi:hypothetical protein